ncbi:monovalent cation:H+ antiporter, CPA1 family [Ekhidna lutea]|uniref:Monovalent cation:H+ antiporter, CPA1 family n=1 Tax=Ekhidna lutea TaxID=447679 RepID=A0A239K6P6_EKHLU|nr:sodium:proton antiporter [Ekhidna lutea]SNT13681.1 monovalent cation:H+ antiporter, CPA1 family [Ekhidna lutea]
MSIFDIIAVLILFSGVFIFINTFYLKLPSSIGLTILAIILSFLVLIFGYVFPEFHLAEHVKKYDFAEVMYRFVLSVMLFAGALNVDFRKLGDQLIPVLVLSFFGVLISTFVIAGLVYFTAGLLGISLHFIACLVFGALISSTDPVAITKTIQRFRMSNELETKISGEALLNGGIAIIMALVLVNIYKEEAAMGSLNFTGAAWILLRDLGGGLIAGLFFGWMGFSVLKYVDNDSVEVEVLVTLALVMGGSYVADLIAVSSMVVAVSTGLILGNFGRNEKGENAVGSYVYRFWQLMEETLAAMLFVLIGFEMLVIPLRLDYFALGFFAVNFALFARWVSVFIPIRLMSMSRSFDDGTIPVLSWGALRGGLPVAASLSLANFPGQELIITMTYIVVVCSVLYQGLTLTKVMQFYNDKHPMKWMD